MLGTLLNLFGQSPFAALQKHMEKVSKCVHLLFDLFEAIEKKDMAKAERIAAEICDLEHQADITKNDIRTHLPKSLFLPIDRARLLEFISIQDKLADSAEDIAVLTTLKPIEFLPNFADTFKAFLSKNIEAVDSVAAIIKEMHELVEASFGGAEAERVNAMINEVSFKEHEVDEIQRPLLKQLFQEEHEMSFTTFHLWLKICEATASLSNLSESLAFRIRMTLELK